MNQADIKIWHDNELGGKKIRRVSYKTLSQYGWTSCRPIHFRQRIQGSNKWERRPLNLWEKAMFQDDEVASNHRSGYCISGPASDDKVVVWKVRLRNGTHVFVKKTFDPLAAMIDRVEAAA